MIELLNEGRYELTETATHTHLLKLDDSYYAWILAKNIGEILVAAKHHHKTLAVLAKGDYKLFGVEGEVGLHDGIHLELSVGEGTWQGYNLPKGLPNGKVRRLIVPVWETVTPELTRMQRVRRVVKSPKSY